MATKPQLILNLAKELKHSFKNVDLNQIDSKFVKSYVYSCDNTGNITGIAIAGDLKKIPTTIVGTSHALSLCEYLTHLNLSNNKIRDISSLGELKNIQTLRLSENQISDISSLKKLKNIQELVLSSNQINDISPLRELKNIKTLDLCKNQINDISPLKELKNIIELDLRHNKIKQLSEWILHFAKVDSIMYNSNFSNCIHITNNPIENVPIEIIKQGKQAIKAYFEEQKKSKSIPNTCVKMVITGNSSVGKTSFINFLTKHTFKQGEITTHGINQTTWKPENTNLDINIWDFGGQEYYHSTHQLFFSNNALYLLMFDKEHNGNGWIESEICYSEKLKVIEKLEHFDYFYWLRNIRNLTDQSKILMLQNKVDNVDDEEYPVKECFNSNNEYRADKPFKAISISNEYKYFEANKNFSDDFVKLQELIISKLNEVKQGNIFEYYLKAKELIETAAQTKPVVSIYEFIQICKPAHDEIHKRIVNEETGEVLEYRWELMCKYFHETGVLLYYPDSPTLKDKIFIRPTFVTDTIYKILNYKVKQTFGRFTFDDAVQSLDNNNELAQDIIELMSAPNFKLIFEYPENSKEYIAPQYLDDKRPSENILKHLTKNLEIEFALEFTQFLPKFILTEFMVNYGLFQKDDIIWKYGIVFEKYGTTSFVEILFHERKIIYKSDKSGEFNRLKYEVFETLRNINRNDKNLKIAMDNQSFYSLETVLNDSRNDTFKFFRFGYDKYRSLLEIQNNKLKEIFEFKDSEELFWKLAKSLEILIRNHKLESEVYINDRLIESFTHEDKYRLQELKQGAPKDGKSYDFIDIVISKKKPEERMISLIEALIHKDTNYLVSHITKAVTRYNTLKYNFVFVITYSRRVNFVNAWDRYKIWHNEYSDKDSRLTKIIVIENNLVNYNNTQVFKFAYSDYSHDVSRKTRIYHIFADFSK